MKDYLKIGQATEIANKKDRRIYRFFEILPGALAWLTLILVVFLSWRAPVFIAFFIIAFDVYWLLKTIFLSLHLRSSYAKTKSFIKQDWLEKLNNLKTYTLSDLEHWREIYHLVIFPAANESLEIIRASFEALRDSDYPNDRIIVVLALEEAGGEKLQETGEEIIKEFGNKFHRLVITTHPQDIPGEKRGKGSNETWAARETKRTVIDFEKIPYEKILVSVFDADTVVLAGYFSNLTYRFLTTKNPLRASYQPIPFFINNIWETPAFARVISFSATFWHMMQQARPERQTTFSSHSMSFQALVDIDFWQVNVVSEDSRIFWQCFLFYNGDYRTVPLFYPVHMDANVAKTFWKTLKNQYKQQRRWGYGVENIPYFLNGFRKNKLIPFRKKLYFSFIIIESFHSWATNALMIFMLGWLPLIIGGQEFNITLLSYNLPKVTRWLMTFAMVGIVSSSILSIILLPPRPPRYGKLKYPFMVLQWLLLPLTIIIFGSLPGLEAQTRLMLGKYMGFWVTEKHRRDSLNSYVELE